MRLKLMGVAALTGLFALGCGAGKTEEQVEVEAKEAADALASALKEAADKAQGEAERAAAVQAEAERQDAKAPGVASSAEAGAMDPEGAMIAQIELLKAGKTEELRSHFTARLQGEITEEAVSKGKAESEKMPPPAELIKEIKDKEVDGVKTAKVIMPSGRVLTTLVLEDGKWLADTVWFR